VALSDEARPVKGILATALQAVAEYRYGLLVPSANADEAAVVEGVRVYPVGKLSRRRQCEAWIARRSEASDRPRTPASLSLCARSLREPADATTPERLFDQSWALT